MVLNGDVLGDALAAGMAEFNNVAIDTTNPVAMANFRKNYWRKVGNIIVAHITQPGTVSVTVTTTGTAAAHTGTGTGKLT